MPRMERCKAPTCWARPDSSLLAPQSFFKPSNVLPWVEPEDCTFESGIKGQGSKSLGPREKTWQRAREEFLCIWFTKCKMCHLVRFHRKHLYACCDSERKNKREADIWERKSVTLKYQKFGSNRTESFGVPLHILEHSLMCGGAVLGTAASLSS